MMRKEMVAKIKELLDNTKNIKISTKVLSDAILKLVEDEGMSPPSVIIKLNKESLYSPYSINHGWEKDNKDKLC